MSVETSKPGLYFFRCLQCAAEEVPQVKPELLSFSKFCARPQARAPCGGEMRLYRLSGGL